MTADTPHPTHGIGTAVLKVMYRGGHATKPSGIRYAFRGGILHGSDPIANAACSVSFSRLTPAARRMHVLSIRTVWCGS